jgi:hypothetical protein
MVRASSVAAVLTNRMTSRANCLVRCFSCSAHAHISGECMQRANCDMGLYARVEPKASNNLQRSAGP